MKNHFAIATLVTLTMAFSTPSAWSADAASDAGQVNLQSASVPALRQSTANAGGEDLKRVSLKHTAHLLTVTIVNSKHNMGTSDDREKSANEMASAIEGGMAGKPEFEGVASIQIDYVSRLGKKLKAIQKFDFFRSAANVFVLHKS